MARRSWIIYLLCITLSVGCANPRDEDDDDDDDDRDRQSEFDYDYSGNVGGSVVPRVDSATKDALLGDSDGGADFDVSASDESALISKFNSILSGLGNGSLPGAGNAVVAALIREIIAGLRQNEDEPHKMAQGILAYLFLDGCIRGYKQAKKAQAKTQRKLNIMTVAICFLKALIMKKAPQLLAMIQDVARSPEALKAMLTQALKPK